MRKINGSALVEYMLPVVLIGLAAGLGIYYLASSGSLTNLFSNSMKSEYNKTKGSLDVNKISDNTTLLVNPAPGSLGGTTSQAVEKCDGTKCNIDFGEFILAGIPENFSDFVQTNGNSGGVSELCNLLLQIADQLEDNGDTAGAKDYRDLANLGYFMADTQKKMESFTEECSTSSNVTTVYNCLNSKLNSTYFKVPENLKSVIPGFSDANFNDLIVDRNFSIALEMQVYKENMFPPSSEAYKPAYKIATIYDKISKDPSYSQAMKDVTTELYVLLSELCMDSFHRYYWGLRCEGLNIAPEISFKRDPVTGQPTSEPVNTYSADTVVEEMVHPVSAVTDLDSSLICATGHNDADGNACSE